MQHYNAKSKVITPMKFATILAGGRKTARRKTARRKTRRGGNIFRSRFI